MRCRLEPLDDSTLKYIRERDRIITQYDHAFGNGKPPLFERKSHVETMPKKSKKTYKTQ